MSDPKALLAKTLTLMGERLEAIGNTPPEARSRDEDATVAKFAETSLKVVLAQEKVDKAKKANVKKLPTEELLKIAAETRRE